MSNEGVYRTAPATPGLLKRVARTHQSCVKHCIDGGCQARKGVENVCKSGILAF